MMSMYASAGEALIRNRFGTDDTGLSGLENQYEERLAGIKALLGQLAKLAA